VNEPTDGGFDVPVTPVRPTADRRRVRTVLVAGVAVAIVVIGLAAIPRDEAGRLAEASSPGATAPGSAAPATSATSSAAPTSRRVEGFVPFPNQPLPGAPTSGLVRRVGDDAEVLAWSPGEDALRSFYRFPGAFGGLGDDPQIATLAPDGRSLLIVAVKTISIEGDDRARLVTADGGIAWEGDHVTGLAGTAWSADSSVLAVPGAPGRWWLVSIDRSGKAAARDLSVVAEPGPTAAPTSSPWVRVVPIGFSENGRWVYGAMVDIGRGSIQPTTRVAIDDGTVEPVADFRSSGSDRLDDRARGILDPATGRTVTFGANASIPGGPPTVEVKEADGAIAFRVEGRVTLGTAWTDDRRLLVLDADGVPFPTGMRLRLVDEDGNVERTLLETGPVRGGGLIGAADGFVSLAFTTDRPEKAVQIVVIRLADGATSAIVLPSAEGILASGLIR
jgi:hypothetical protein